MIPDWKSTFQAISKAFSTSKISFGDYFKPVPPIDTGLDRVYESYLQNKPNNFWSVTTTTRDRPYYHPASYAKRWKRKS